MNLNEITANIRLRNPWEAIDLGFSMVQEWWKFIYFPLAILTFSIASILYLVVPNGKIWIASLVFWWLKPLYDRLVLHVVSHKLFNNELSSWQVLKALPSLVWNTGFFQTITFRRFSFSRGFNLPIWQLEQLRGAQRANRQGVLHQIAHTQAIWLTIVLAHVEFILVFSLFGLMLLFLPEKTANDFFVGIFSNKVEYAEWIDVLDYTFYIVVVTFIHPFYIAANFALYINRRTQLEAWDLELDFRKMATRLKSLSKTVTLGLIFTLFSTTTLFTPSTSYADEAKLPKPEKTEFLAKKRLNAKASKEIIQKTMLTKELNDKQTINYWVKKKTPKKEKNNSSSLADLLEPFAKIIGLIIEFGLWIFLGIGIFLLFYFRESWLHLFNIKRKVKTDDYQAPEVMFGMDVRPESLPVDIIGEATELWNGKHHRESLSLLYRGALVRLINQEQIKLKDSYTEGDVLHHSKQKLSNSKLDFLKKLTKNWKLIAYAHRNPNDSDMHELFNSWIRDFAVIEQEKSNE